MVFNIHKSVKLLLLIFGVVAAVPLSIRHNKKPDSRTVFSRGSTEIDVTRMKYHWTINNFNVDDYVNGQRVNSPTFVTHDDCEWYIFLYPKGYDSENKDYMSIFILSVSCKIIANVEFAILNNKREATNIKSFYYSFPVGGNIGFNKFIEQDFVLNSANGLLKNNTLTIVCEVNATISSTDNPKKPLKLSQNNDLGKDFEFLIDNEFFSDVKLSAGGKELSALKGILAARSPIFKSMFEVDIQEENVSRIDIADVSADVVKEMLRYIYTGEVSNLQDLAPSLLIVAEKYELTGLKTMCENSMSANLTIDNAAEFYIFGDTYYAVHLKNQAKDFIVDNASSVILTPGFKSLIQTHPTLVEEIFSAITKQNGNTT